MSNLLDNALKYGRAEVPIEVAARALDGRALLVVSDGGPGVRADLRERIFEPFYRDPLARAAQPGHGLGLPLARAVARAHGGDLQVGPSPAGGAQFELSLPLVDGRDPAPAS